MLLALWGKPVSNTDTSVKYISDMLKRFGGRETEPLTRYVVYIKTFSFVCLENLKIPTPVATSERPVMAAAVGAKC